MGSTKLEDTFKQVMLNVMMSELNGDVVLDDTQITQTLLKNDDKNRFEQIYKIMKDHNLLPDVIQKTEKSDERSEQLRADGNQAYVKTKDNLKALQLYTKAICAACPDSREIALAYANRSAVTFDLQEYKNSIDDIGRALSNEKYPNHLKHKLYERRGKCFMTLSLYSIALENFNCAKTHLQNCEDDQSKAKSQISQMENLIKPCQDKPDKPLDARKILPKLSQKQSPYIKAASAAVDIKISSEMGRHVIAASNIKPGDVLAVESPYVSILLPSNNYDFCHNCKRRSHSLIPCTNCTEVMFCSEKCRQDSWTEYHSIECDILPALYRIFGDDNTNSYLALRILIKASKCGKNLDSFVDDYSGVQKFRTEEPGKFSGKFLSDYTSVRELLTHEGSRTLQNKVQEEITAACVVHLLSKGTSFFQQSESQPENTGLLPFHVLVAARMIVIYCMICSCNAHEIELVRSVPSIHELNDQKSFKIGSAVYPLHALMNHSCDPNVIRSIVGDKSYIIAVQPIHKGQQIFDSYKFLYTIVPFPARQKYFKEKYFFTCKCSACQQKWPTFVDIPNGPPKYLSNRAKEAIPNPAALVSKIAKTMVEIGKGNISDEQFEFLSQYITVIHKNIQRPWKPYLMCLSSIKYFLTLKTHHLNN